MNVYYDTGVLLKLYTLEKESKEIRDFVLRRRAPLFLHTLHLSECTSALKLKVFRGECDDEEANSALADIEEDVQSGVIRTVPCDWDEAWLQCRFLARTFAARTGCRTLDTLHVACALQLACRELVSTDKRQSDLARAAGLKVVNPCE
jgi:predicted nucleic acid-binding protein